MSALQNNKINALVRELKDEGRVEFPYDGLYYEIFESVNGGYAVNAYSDNVRDTDGILLDELIVDGGHCQGTAMDAIRFIL